MDVTIESNQAEESSYQTALERYRGYLRLLAQMNLGAQFRGKLDPSDVVQQTLVEALRSRSHYRGTTDAEMTAWLREILARSMSKALRAFGTAKRDLAREQSLQADLDASSAKLETFLAADQSSPSVRAANQEQLLRLIDVLGKLPDKQREAMTLRHCHGWPVVDIARHFGTSSAAVIGLLKRGLREVQEQLQGTGHEPGHDTRP